MGTTPRYNLPYAEPNDLVRNHPNVVSRPLAERVEDIVGTLADDQTAGDTATLNAAKSHADTGDTAVRAYADSIASARFPLHLDVWTDAPADSMLETGLYRQTASYPKAANGWPAAIEGMNAAIVIRRLWSSLVHQEVRGWSVAGGTQSYTRWVRIGGSGTTPWATETDRGTYSTGVRDITGSVHTDQGWNPVYGPKVQVSRTGTFVELAVESLGRTDGGYSGNRTVIDLPLGFRPATNKYPVTWRSARGYIARNGQVRITDPGGQLDYFALIYTTADDPPTTLPGTPA